MKCALLTIGTEILFGQITNTNAVYLSEKLQKMGIDVLYHVTVGDNAKRLKKVLSELYEDCGIVITTGGLGPTQDDMTKETAAAYFGEKLVLYPRQLDILRTRFERSSRPMTENNIKQAYFPENNCTVLPNLNGSAPGFMIRKDGKCLISMPGPPAEMRPMFEDHAAPILKEWSGSMYYTFVNTTGVGESMLETLLMPLIDGQTDPTFATYFKDNICTVRVASKRETSAESKKAVDEAVEKVMALAGDYVFSVGETDLQKTVADHLMEHGITISAAESCTGGMFASSLTDRAGISSVFKGSYVTYSNEAKIKELGVSEKTIDEHTAVSSKTALEMAEGLFRKTGADICVSVTGYAGPGKGERGEDPGLYFIGLGYEGKFIVREYHDKNGSRLHVRTKAVNDMYSLIYETIIKPSSVI